MSDQPTLAQLVEAFCETVEAASSARGTRGGQKTNGGPLEFEHVLPSTAARLDWWARELRAAVAREALVSP